MCSFNIMKIKLFLCIWTTYQITSYTAADDLNDGGKTNEDDFSLRLMTPGIKQSRIVERAAGEVNNTSNDDDNVSSAITTEKSQLVNDEATGEVNNTYDDDDRVSSVIITEKSQLEKDEEEEYEAEKKKGDMSVLFGTNQHHSYPEFFNDLGRRFVLQYPYKEVSNINKEEEAEFRLHNIVKGIADKNQAEAHLIPVKAPPEFVLAVATKAALLEAALPRNPIDENFANKEILRSGDYWNNVWQEDVDPGVLRTREEKVIESVNVKVMPVSKLYNLVLELKKISPRLIYVINKD